jgi:hypothetical protein
MDPWQPSCRLFFLFLYLWFGAVVSSYNLHSDMSKDEMVHYFGTSDADAVDTDNYEIVSLSEPEIHVTKRANASTGRVGLNYAFDAFGQHFDLKMEKNDVLLSPFNVGGRVLQAGGKREPLQKSPPPPPGKRSDCHFLHKSLSMTAAFSACNRSLNGMIFTKKEAFEVRELTDGLKKRAAEGTTTTTAAEEKGGKQTKKLYLVKRTPMDEIRKTMQVPDHGFNLSPVDKNNIKKLSKRKGGGGGKPVKFFLETAVFVDNAAYKRLGKFYNYDMSQIEDFIMCYMNGVQAVFHLYSLGTTLELSIRHLEVFGRHPKGLSIDGDREVLYNDFCEWQNNLNSQFDGDSDPGHWDIALLLSGVDFYDSKSSSKSKYVTMGLSAVGGICTGKWQCVIGEMGATAKSSGRTYPSSGLTSVYIVAHEIGHNLGMRHDKGNCDKKHIMASSRGLVGKNDWSPCSARALNPTKYECLLDEPSPSKYSLDPKHPNNPWMPGEVCHVDCQCKMFYMDRHSRNAHTDDNLRQVCETVLCSSPERPGGIFRVGPALEGTQCGEGKWCNDGHCVRAHFHEDVVDGKPYLGPWKTEGGGCQSKCLIGSKGNR